MSRGWLPHAVWVISNEKKEIVKVCARRHVAIEFVSKNPGHIWQRQHLYY